MIKVSVEGSETICLHGFSLTSLPDTTLQQSTTLELPKDLIKK